MPKFPVLIVLGSWSLFCAGLAAEVQKVYGAVVSPILLLCLAAVPWVAAKGVADRQAKWRPPLEAQMRRHTELVDALPARYNWLWIALAAGAGLYLELVFIRFHASCFQLFAFFKNFSLLSCFLGLGIGYALGAGRPLLTPLVLPLLAAQAVFLHALRHTGVEQLLHNPVAEHLALGLEQSKDWVHAGTVYGFLFFVFSLNALTFIPLGHLASRLMGRSPRLVAYGWNLAGSLAGILAFYVLSMVWAPPAAWLALGALALVPFVRSHLGAALASAVVMVCFVGTSFRTGQYDLYSPYQVLSLRHGRDPYPEVLVNHVYFQKVFKLDDPRATAEGPARLAAGYYNLPYLAKPAPPDVLVVGAGTGNDVAAALRNGAGRVDAVEIDPAILKLGRMLHPEAPYQNGKVHAIVNDARGHIRHTSRQYDLIVYGLLDSHTLLSGMSGVRLDSYVYTVEAFREARARLKDGGVVCLTFAVIRPELSRKLYLMLKTAFDGRDPWVIGTSYDGGNAFIIGDRTDPAAAAKSVPLPPAMMDVTPIVAGKEFVADVSTDDWPFFYMPVRSYPVSYAIMVAALLVVALLIVRGLMPGGRGGFSAPCFFLGAGFMLLETKAITELALFYGSTWVVVGVVIAAILIMAFLANLLLIRVGTVNPAVVYGLLLLSLGARLVLDLTGIGAGAGGAAWVSRALMTAALTLPLFFAGLAFSMELTKASSVGVALGSNLLGGMLGGCLEYNSMYFGYRSLYVLALALYGLAFVSSFYRRAPSTPEAAPAAAAARAPVRAR